MIWNSGAFCLHLLHRKQMDLVYRLGFQSGRDGDKFADLPHRLGQLGLPVLDDKVAAFELRVINTMDAGYATLFLGHVEAVHPGRDEEILTPPWFRAHMPKAWEPEWLANYRHAQDVIDSHTAIADRRWTGPSAT
jgi:flavin reductase (DIM6/NTAB) family NADH-FMN oxidoreductase RutF